MWRRLAPAGRRCLGTAGVGTGKLQGDSACAAQAKLRLAASASCKHLRRAAPSSAALAGPGLLAHVLVAKYCDHQPLYRQTEMYAREGVELERSTLADWVGGTSRLLEPLVEALRRHVLSAHKLHADDTPVPVLAPGNGKTKTGRLWTYVRDDRPAGDNTPAAVWFAYSPDRRGEHPREHLRSFSGTLQADAYAGFHHLYESGRIQEAACWAHVRRKFYDLAGSACFAAGRRSPGTHCRVVCHRKRDSRSAPDERRKIRNTRARPCWTRCITGCNRRWLSVPKIRDGASDPLCAVDAGMRCCITRKTAASRSIVRR